MAALRPFFIFIGMSVTISNTSIINSQVNRSLIMNGLQLYVDFANLKTYSGSGTDVFDLTDNNNDMTVSGPTFSTNNGGYFSFDGSNDLIYGAQASNPYNLSKQITYEFWFRWTQDGGGDRNMILNKENSFEVGINDSEGYLQWAIRSDAQSWAWLGGSSTGDLRDSNWHYGAITRSETAVERMYLDGEFQTSANRTDSPIQQNNNRLHIGSRGGGTNASSAFGGDIGIVRIHNVELTANEIRNNYLVQSPRYQ